MKIFKYLTVSALAAFTLFSVPSCQNLDQHYEGGTLDDEQVIQAVNAIPERINSSVSGMYALLGKPDGYFGSGRADDAGYPGIAISQDLNSGIMTNIVSGYDWFTVALEWSDRTPTYANPQMRFGLFYKVLYAVRDVLAAIPENTDKKDLIYKRGEAKAMRAFAYLSLAPYFQFKYKGNEDKPSVPMMLDGVDARNNPRAPLKDLYAYILKDLADAISDLNGYKRANKGVIDQSVAYGLRARVYLNMENWAEAAKDAESAMAGYTPYEISELTTPGFYNATDHNWIWALLLPNSVVSSNNYATWPSQLGSFSGDAYVPYGGIYRSINVLLYKKIPSTDVRKNWWLNESKQSPYLDGLSWKDEAKGITYTGQAVATASIADVKQPMDKYANVKFGQRSGVGSAYNDGDWCMMRAEEMILIDAEATAKAGNLTKGKQILSDFVKTYRNPSYVSNSNTLEEFENEIWFQRRIELWGEGFAMSDVMRLGRNVVRFRPGQETNVPATYQFNIANNDPWMLLRFVQRETTNNAGVVNNTGGTQPKSGDGSGLTDGLSD